MTGSLAQRLALRGALPRNLRHEPGPLRIGFLAPLSGPFAPGGAPGLEGCRIWADWVNDDGGMSVGTFRRPVEIIARDAAISAGQTVEYAREQLAAGVHIVLALGGESLAPALPLLMQQRVLTTTLLPFDLNPAAPSLIAPVDLHPLFVVVAVEWLARNWQGLRRVALCSQQDLMGLPALATYRAAFLAAGFQIVDEAHHDGDRYDAPALVSRMLAAGAEALCWCGSEPHMIHALTLAAFDAGFTGPMLACTGDGYERMVAQTSVKFMENFVFHFPDFDDPALADTAFFYRSPASFFLAYRQRSPAHWSAVSWEYAAALDLWHAAVEIAGSADPVRVLPAMKRGEHMMHVFGPARWYGERLFGIDNALIGCWPVVAVRDGVAQIVDFGSVLDWLVQHEDLLMRELAREGLALPQLSPLA
ncbi:MAG: ABC transporter substrate-binding protein [Paracoccus sp. (in: a-proteobacteria)]|nr:ABC transporter substrate-binding protein [Paracoccus sp. (in: a-proteobacteria)]